MIETVLKGASALLMKSPAMADPDNELQREVKKITDKKSNMTTQDRQEKARLQWFGSLYLVNGRIVMPSNNLLRCFVEAGRMTSDGPKVERALSPVDPHLDLEFPDKGLDVKDLWLNPAYRYETMVNANPSRGKKSMVPSTRPMFTKWAITAHWELFEKALDYSRFLEIVEAAGLTQGIGDNRRNGFGRFHVEVRKL